MAWPEVVFIGTYPGVVDRLAHLADFAPYDLEVVVYEPDDTPEVLPWTTVAVIVDQWDLREHYSGLPTLCHDRLGNRHRHLGKWSISITGMDMDTGYDSLESGSSHVSDDNEARQFCLLFLLAAIERSLRNEEHRLRADELLQLIDFDTRMSSYLAAYEPTDPGVHTVYMSLYSIRLERGNRVLDREIIRRCLHRIEDQVPRFDTFADIGELRTDLTLLIQMMRVPGPGPDE